MLLLLHLPVGLLIAAAIITILEVVQSAAVEDGQVVVETIIPSLLRPLALILVPLIPIALTRSVDLKMKGGLMVVDIEKVDAADIVVGPRTVLIEK